jgi:RNA polymerase sigma-70 factor (ECF subfamily)
MTVSGEGAGGEARFRALYESGYGRILGYARRRAGEDLARDIAAETFLTAWRRLDESLAGGLPWLYQTASYVSQNMIRSEVRAARVVDRLHSITGVTYGDDAADIVDRDRVERALALLAPIDRELLTLVSWEGLSVKDASSAVGMSLGAASVRLHRVRRRLRVELADCRVLNDHIEGSGRATIR